MGISRAVVGLPGARTCLSLCNALDPIARFHGTDKASTHHAYTPYYARHLGPRRLRKNVVFEIGVGGYKDPASGGQSLRTWRDYLLRSRIVGIDVEDKQLTDLGRRVTLARADQSDGAQLLSVVERCGAPDIVIDDGSHLGDHIVASFNVLFPLLRDGGWYVIEDLNASFIPDFGGSIPPGENTGIGLVRALVESAQSLDPTFSYHWDRTPPRNAFGGVGGVHVYPGIAFVEKASSGDAGSA